MSRVTDRMFTAIRCECSTEAAHTSVTFLERYVDRLEALVLGELPDDAAKRKATARERQP